MYTAEEARTATKATVSDEYLEEVLEKVKEAAESGVNYLVYTMKDDSIRYGLMYRLADQGFNVQYGTSSMTLNIYW